MLEYILSAAIDHPDEHPVIAAIGFIGFFAGLLGTVFLCSL